MNQFKRAKVVMLPTNKEPIKGDLLLRHIWRGDPKLESCTLWQYEDTIVIDGLKQHTVRNSSFRDWHKAFVAVNISIISDDEIKEGDYILNIETNNIFKSDSIEYLESHNIIEDFDKSFYINSKYAKKIIATTDKTLSQTSRTEIPQPSQQFIEKYIEEYNKDNIIIDVLVEYEQDYTNRSCSTCNLGTDGTCELKLEKKCCSNTNNVTKHGDYWISCLDEEEDSEIYKIKINPKDNTITIKKLKDSWNREEIIEQMWLAYKASNTIFEDESALRVEFNNWIDKNL